MKFEPVKKVSSYELIVEQIEAGVREGRLHPGDRLPGERVLMQTFSVSRATVREAMRVLHATGVVHTRAGDPRGPEVLPFRPEALERPLVRMTDQEGTTRVELIQFRLLLESQSALLAAATDNEDAKAKISACAGDLATLADRATTAESQTELREEFGVLLSEFHSAIRAASGNQLLQATGQAVDGALTTIARRRLGDEADGPALAARLRQSALDAATLNNHIQAQDPIGARQSAADNIFRFYKDRLTDEEQQVLAPLVG
ncbi:FadR/GntR family transcriptional regulator [Nesterenkonia alkaliphila]|uniref:GntR family transcriptional regulator n=1 Tax=Nesterenkonia alkaliphila TaxID=1463631 RepID=A0A7K1UGE4_9MICC|nr:GntR family transcriptional regulator [Nesterenkonia alkaliphila]MVT25545.1 GntR family transcriptional regulator [Nesterenkonia alkaliphila]GFZ91008.1 GntR family transcriptional regulator [Nesterenkonia alkaliphila]